MKAILILAIILVIMGTTILALSYFLNLKTWDPEKMAAYECGFDPFDDARSEFDVRFYIIAVVYILFDLEIAFLFPWAITLQDIGFIGFWSMLTWLAICLAGFIYEIGLIVQ